jgi:polysaccharide export outer membrane protein
VTVTVAEVKSRFVYITGEVSKPGAYSLAAPTDVLQLIIKAGGLTPFARSKSIVVLRVADGKQQKLPVNYKKLIRGEYSEQNILLLPGDTVVVP